MNARNDQEWREQVDATLQEHREQLAAGKERFAELERKVDANNEMTARIDTGVAEILMIFGAFKGAVKVGGWLGTGVKWLAAVVIAVGILYWVWKTGDLPRKL